MGVIDAVPVRGEPQIQRPHYQYVSIKGGHGDIQTILDGWYHKGYRVIGVTDSFILFEDQT
jgi:hypothetical protein